MSTYLISDMHGEKKIFDKLIKDLDFQVDKLYILGDVIDRGHQSMELLDEVRSLMATYPQNICMIKGNHELFCEMYIDGRLSETVWLSESYGGGPMLKAMTKMSKDQIHAKIQRGYESYKAGRTQNAAEAFNRFRENHS